MNKRMQKLLLDGDCLKAGIARGDVLVVLTPPQSKRNDTKMKKRSGILYGSTIWTDEQIIYFYRKHDGNATAAARELRMYLNSYKQRLSKLGLVPKGQSVGSTPLYTDKQIRASMKKAKGNMRQASVILGCSYATMQTRAKRLDFKANDVGFANSKYTDKQIRVAVKKAKGNFANAARILGCSYGAMLHRAHKLGLRTKDGLSGRKKTWTDQQIRAAIKKAKGNMRQAALTLGCHYITLINRAYTLGLKSRKP